MLHHTYPPILVPKKATKNIGQCFCGHHLRDQPHETFLQFTKMHYVEDA